MNQGSVGSSRKKIAFVLGQVPNTEEIDQYRLLTDQAEFVVITADSIAQYLKETSAAKNLSVIALPDHDDNPTYLPGLEKVLEGFDLVIVKERLGLYAYQVLKAKWRQNFKMAVIIDNAMPFAGHDINQMRIIRSEITRAADLFCVATETARSALLLEGVEEDRIVKILPFAERKVTRNHQNRLKARSVLKLAESDFVVCHTGQLEWEEGIFDLVEAARIAIDEDASMNRRLRLVFCGVGSAGADLRARIHQLKLDDRCAFVAPSRDALTAIYLAADAYYHAPFVSRDRLDADPYRLLTAMVNKLPIIACRTPMVEEIIGKHRVDFCASSRRGLVEALHKACDAKALVGNIVNKNLSELEKRFSRERSLKFLNDAILKLQTIESPMREVSFDKNVAEIEAKVHAKLFLEAIDLIEPLVHRKDLPIYHRANLYRLIGDCFVKLGDDVEGKNAYVKALELDPYLAKAHIGLGALALTRSSFDAAVLTFQKAVSFAPDDEMAHLGLALSFEGIGDLAEANKWAKSSVALNADNTVAIFSLVKISHERGSFADARAALCRYIERNPHDVNMMFALAGVEFRDQKYDSAERVCQELLAIDGNDERTKNLLNQIQTMRQSGVQARA